MREEKKVDFLKLEMLLQKIDRNYQDEWLARLEIYELAYGNNFPWVHYLREFLKSKTKNKTDLSRAIQKSLQIIES